MNFFLIKKLLFSEASDRLPWGHMPPFRGLVPPLGESQKGHKMTKFSNFSGKVQIFNGFTPYKHKMCFAGVWGGLISA